MSLDSDQISGEKHELNYVLKKYGKKQSSKNHDLLTAKVKDFKGDTGYQPHNRDSFYKYVDDNKIEDMLE